MALLIDRSWCVCQIGIMLFEVMTVIDDRDREQDTTVWQMNGSGLKKRTNVCQGGC